MHVHQEPHCCNWGLKDKAPHIESEMVGVGTEQLLDKEFRCNSLHLTSNQADIQHTQKQGYSSHSLSHRQQERFTASAAAKCCTNIKRENSDEEFTDMKELVHSEEHLQDFNMVSSMHEARCADPRDSKIKSNGFRKKLYSSDSSSSEGAASEGGNGWTDPCEEELFSRTHL